MLYAGIICGCTGTDDSDSDSDSGTAAATDVEWDTEVNTGPYCDPATSVPGGCLDVAPGAVSGPHCGGSWPESCFTIDVPIGGEIWAGCVVPLPLEDGSIFTDEVLESRMETAYCHTEELAGLSRQTPYVAYGYDTAGSAGGSHGDQNWLSVQVFEAVSRQQVGKIVPSRDEAPDGPCDFYYLGSPTVAPLAIAAAAVLASRLEPCSGQGDECDLCACVTNGVTDAAPAGCEAD